MLTAILLQIGISLTGFAETFYTRNIGANVALDYTTKGHKTHRAGFFYQTATINGEGEWNRYGAFIDVNLASVDKIAIFYVGARYGINQKQFYELTPHFTLAWRFNRWVEIPCQISTYASRMVASIGIRGMFRLRSDDYLYYKKRRALQPTKTDRVFTHQ
jgi:hypothetical protein